MPQSLLRGFGVQKGKKTYVVAYTFDHGIFSPPTDGIGAERSFYSELNVEGATETLDDKITDYEQRIPAVLDLLREVSADVEPAVAAELVTHLTVRNDHFRKATSSASADLITGITQVVGNEDGARALLGLTGDQPSELLATELQKMWAQYSPILRMAGMTQAQFSDFAFRHAKANFSAFHAETAGPLREAFGGMIDKLPETAADAQRRALTENLTPPIRVERLSQLRWKTVASGLPLVLPDCVAVGIDRENGILPLMLVSLDKLEAVFMPLASDRMLVGGSGEAAGIPPNVNEAFASCSWDFFVARDRTAELEGFREALRATTEKFMSLTVSEAIDQAMAENRS